MGSSPCTGYSISTLDSLSNQLARQYSCACFFVMLQGRAIASCAELQKFNQANSRRRPSGSSNGRQDMTQLLVVYMALKRWLGRPPLQVTSKVVNYLYLPRGAKITESRSESLKLYRNRALVAERLMPARGINLPACRTIRKGPNRPWREDFNRFRITCPTKCIWLQLDTFHQQITAIAVNTSLLIKSRSYF